MQIKMPNGDMVDFPDDMPKDQIQGMIAKKFPDAQADQEAIKEQATPFGRITSGLRHGVESPVAEGMKMMGMKPWQSYRAYEETRKDNPSDLRDWSETIGGAVPSLLLRTEGAIPTAIGGGVIGATQPAQDWKERLTNSITGAVTAELGPGAGQLLKHPKIVERVNHLVNDAIGIATGHHYYGLGGAMGGLLTGEAINWRSRHLLPQGGLTGLLAKVAKHNPGLAAYLGVQANPSQALPAVQEGYEWMTTPDQQGQ